MKKYSMVASLAAVMLALGIVSPSALAVEAGDPSVPDDPSATQLDTAPSEEPFAAPEDEELPGPAAVEPDPVQPEATDPAPGVEVPDPADDLTSEAPAVELPAEVNPSASRSATEGTSAAPESSAMEISPMSVGTFPEIADLLDPDSMWPLPTGMAIAELDPAFKRGSDGYHDPFAIVGGFAIPDVSLLATPLKQALKGQLCSNPLVTGGVDAAIRLATGVEILPTILTRVDATNPDAAGLCSAYVDGLDPTEILNMVPLDVRITMTNQDDPSDVRQVTVPFRSGSLSMINGYIFGAMSTDFPGGYFNAGTYTIDAELMADATVGLPEQTVMTTVNWTGRSIRFPFPTVTGVTDVDISFPPIDLNYTFENEPIAKLMNQPTMTIIEAPTVDASWDYSVGLQVNGAGYDGTVTGKVGFGDSLENFNQYFRTDLQLYRVGSLRPLETVSVALNDDFTFSYDFPDLAPGRYFAVPSISSTRLLPVPVTGDMTYLQVVDVKADFESPVLGCGQESGNYQMSGSIHNNLVAPISVTVELNGPDGVLDSQTVAPTRTHFDLSAQVPPGSYFGTITARDARPVIIDGPDVIEGECAAITNVQWSPPSAENVCPAMTADSTIGGTVIGYGEGYNLAVAVYPGARSDGAEPIFTQDNVPVDPADGSFAVPVQNLPGGLYLGVVTLTYQNGESEEVAFETSEEVALTVTARPCGSLSDVAFVEPVVANVCPAATAYTTLTGAVAQLHDHSRVTYELYYGAGPANAQLKPVPGHTGTVTIKADGSFAVPVSGLGTGNYTARVTLFVGENEVESAQTTLEVKSVECTTPGPAALANTGAGILPILLLGVCAIGAGFALTRRSRKC